MTLRKNLLRKNLQMSRYLNPVFRSIAPQHIAPQHPNGGSGSALLTGALIATDHRSSTIFETARVKSRGETMSLELGRRTR